MGKALLIIVLGFSTIFSGIIFNFTSSQRRSSQAIVTEYERWIARNAIESAANMGISKLFQSPIFSWGTAFTNQTFNGAQYSVTYTDVTGDSIFEAKALQVLTSVSYAGITDTSVAVYIQPAYSYFYFYLNNWPGGPTLEYDTGDTVAGPIHSNQPMRISNNPVFIGKVSSDETGYQGISNPNPKFYGGAEFGTQAIATPDLTPIRNVAIAGGDEYTTTIWVRFNADSTYETSTNGIIYSAPISMTAYNGTIITTGATSDIHVQGTVNGQMTVIAGRDILIEDDIVYNENPTTNPNSNDYLGLIARTNVTIVNNLANASNVNIHAAVLARDGSFNVPGYNLGLPRGILTLVGSLVENNYSEFGTYLGPITLTGYAFNHQYDTRLITRTPPYFPRILNRIEKAFRSD